MTIINNNALTTDDISELMFVFLENSIYNRNMDKYYNDDFLGNRDYNVYSEENKKRLKSFIDKGADIYYVHKGKTLVDLIMGLSKDSYVLYWLKIIHDFGYNMNTKNKKGETALFQVLFNNNEWGEPGLGTWLCTEELLQKLKCNPNTFTNNNENCFTRLMKDGNIEMLEAVQRYSRFSIDYNLIKKKTGKTLLMFYIDTINDKIKKKGWSLFYDYESNIITELKDLLKKYSSNDQEANIEYILNTVESKKITKVFC